jgi:diguanylate cyclase (GGDEF)-like protein
MALEEHELRGIQRGAAMRVLLVEDNPGDALLMREMLGEAEPGAFDLEAAATLAEARASLERARPDVVLLDLGLPDSCGLDTLVRMHELAPDLPVVVLTGMDDQELAVRAVQAHAQEYLVKAEVGPASLVRALRQAIERERLQNELRLYTRALEGNASRLREMIAASADGLLVLDATGRILFANPAATALAGRGTEALLGEVVDLPEENAIAELELAPGRAIEVRAASIEWEGERAWLATLRDITARKSAEAALKQFNSRLIVTNSHLQQLAYVDPLTELLNRRGLDRVLQTEVSRARRNATQIIACLIDCDDFKRVNDEHGHAVGDSVLLEIARRIKDSLRPSDHLARIGGDEFLVLLPDARFAEGMSVAERLRRSVCELAIELTSGAVSATVSVGIAPVAPGASSLEDVLEATQAALRQSKVAGKNRVHLAGTARPPEVASLLEPGGLTAVRQPIVRLEGEQVEGYELLSRGPQGPLHSPEAFFGLCASRGALELVDLRCLRTCLAAAEALDLEPGSRVHVNLMPSTLVETPLERLIALFLDGRGASRRYCIELSEQQLVGDALPLQGHLRGLRQAGIGVAIDDVGFGRSSLETLILLEPDMVKIAPAFVQGSSRDVAKETWLRRLVHVARALGSEPLAEGIESREDLELLQSMGVGYGQGYLWGQPA